MPSQVFPLLGLNQSITPRMAPSGTLRRAENCEMLQDGALRVRPGYTALGLTTYGLDSAAEFTPYDLHKHRENLVALGDSLGFGYPTDVFQYLDGVANSWRPTAAEFGEVPRLGSLTGARNVGDVVDQEGTVDSFSMAVSGNYVAIVWQTTSGGTPFGYLHVVDSSTDRTVVLRGLLDQLVIGCQVEAVPGEETFVIAGISALAQDEVFTSRFSPATDEIPSVPEQVLDAAGSDRERVVMAPGGSGEVVIAASGANTTIQSCRTDGTASGTASYVVVGTTASSPKISICAYQPDNWVLIAHTELTAVRLNGRNYSTGGANFYIGTTVATTANEFTAVALWRVGDEADIAMTDTGGALNVNRRAQLTPLSGSVGTLSFLQNFRMLAAPAHVESRAQLQYLGGGYGEEGSNGSEALIAYHLDPADMAPECAIGDSTVTLDPPPRLVVTDTELFWPRTPLNEDGFGAPQVTRFRRGSTERRQSVEFAGSLYIGGALPVVYAGRSVVEQGYPVDPEPLEIASLAGAGALQAGGTYRYRMHWEWVDEGRRTHRSAVSALSEITLLPGHNQVTIIARVPLSLRTSSGAAQLGSALRCVVYRTAVFSDPANTSLLLIGETFHRTAVAYVPTTQDPGSTIVFSDTRADESSPIDLDNDLIAQGILYTQATALGDDKSPGPADYCGISRDRLVLGGLPDLEEWRVSKRLANRAPVRWADAEIIALKGRISGEVLAVRQLGDVIAVFSRHEVWAVSGVGPDDSGAGEYFPPTRIPSDGGIDPAGWQSMVETEKGLFFKLGDGKLYLLDRALKMTWYGHAAVEHLEQFPDITCATYTAQDQTVAWGLRSADQLTGGILRHDLRSEAWFFDPVGPVASMVQYEGRRTILLAGSVLQQDETAGIGAVPAVLLETSNFQFNQSLGWGNLMNIALMGTYQGPCRILLEVDYQDGLGYDDSATWLVDDSEADPEGKVVLPFQPCQQDQDAFRLRITMTPDNGSRGVELNAVAVEHQVAPNLSRRGDSDRR
jgi:hypothetical protein